MTARAAPKKGTERGAAALRDFHEEQALGRAYDARLLRRLLPFARPHLRLFVTAVVMLLLVAALNLARPIILGRVIANAQAEQPSGLLRHAVLLSLVVVGMQLLAFGQMYLTQLAGARAMADLRSHIFDFLQRLELRYYDRTPIGRLVTRATNDVDALGELFVSGVMNALGDLVALAGIVVVMVALDVRMSLIAFASLPVVSAIVWFVRGRAREAYRGIRAKTARLNAFLNEQVAGMSVVQAYARERQMAQEFSEINGDYRDANKLSIFYEAVLDAAVEMVSTVCIASLLWWAGLKHVVDPTITFPLVVVFTQYIRQFFEPVALLAQRYTILQAAMSGAERIFKLLDEGDVEPTRAGALDGGSAAPDEAVAFEDVVFAYRRGIPILKNVSLHVRRGEKVALVGATGAGKTTVTSVLLRLYEFEEGRVRVFGRDIRAYDRRELRDLFAVVPQDVFLFAGTIASNVALSDLEPDRARVEQALAKVGALESFLRRPGGLDARVNERGSNFSAGERQLIAFARALYKDAPILILDEATASIDSDTEARLQAALSAVLSGRTALVIAHRLSTIRTVDRIVVFHRGRVVEAGTHEELMAKDQDKGGGVYARLHRLQFATERLAESASAESRKEPENAPISFRP